MWGDNLSDRFTYRNKKLRGKNAEKIIIAFQYNKRIEFRNFKVGECVNIYCRKFAYHIDKYKTFRISLSGIIISIQPNCIIIEDFKKNYNKFTVNINSYIIGDIIIKKLNKEEIVNE